MLLEVVKSIKVLSPGVALTYQWSQRCPGCWERRWPAGWWKWAEWKRWQCAGASRKSCWGTSSAGSPSAPNQPQQQQQQKQFMWPQRETINEPADFRGKQSHLLETAQWAQWAWRQWALQHARTKSKCRTDRCGCRCEAAQLPLHLEEIRREENREGPGMMRKELLENWALIHDRNL